MAAVSIAPLFQQQNDLFNIIDPLRVLQGFESPEQSFFEPEIQMEFCTQQQSTTQPYNQHLVVVKHKSDGQHQNSYSSQHQQQQQQDPQAVVRSPHQQQQQHTQLQLQHNNSTSSEFNQLINFVDSPPDSKESWPVDYLKPSMPGGANNKMVAIPEESHQLANTNGNNNNNSNISNNMDVMGLTGIQAKKRRMNWDALDELSVPNHRNEVTAPMAANKDVSQHQHDRRKSGRFIASNEEGTNGGAEIASANNQNGGGGGNAGLYNMTEDIDFDLNNELSSNGYMNDPLFYQSLTVFKQEVPSPTAQDKNGNGQVKTGLNNVALGQGNNANNNGELLGKRTHDNVVQNNNNNNNNMGSPQGNDPSTDLIANNMHPHQQQSQICHMQQQQPNQQQQQQQQQHQQQSQQQLQNGAAENNGADISNVNFQLQLQDNQNFDKPVNGKVTPPMFVDKSARAVLIDDNRFQYVLAAATSIATKNNEDTLTYLNQGQSYEIKLKKLGDLTNYRNKILKSVIKICFYERRLQYMEKEQMQQWQVTRPGERILEIDVPLSYGLCQASQPSNPNLFNSIEVHWDPMKEVGVYIKVNCISTEFTPKKHGGEKGVPFRIQVETYLDNKPVHGAVCQIKVFKLKGADRKHKQDREKIQKRPVSEQEKFQPSYECTILNDIPKSLLQATNNCSLSPTEHIPTIIASPTTNASKYEAAGIQFAYNHQNSNSNSNSSTNSNPLQTVSLNRQVSVSNPNLCKTLEMIPSPPASVPIKDYYEMNIQITKETTPQQLAQWINFHRLSGHMSTFSHFSGADLLRLTKDDLTQICGVADGIRMYNILHRKAITPRLTIFVRFESNHYNAVYLYTNKLRELTEKLQNLPGFKAFYKKSQAKSESVTANGNTFVWEMHQDQLNVLDEGDSMDYEVYLSLPTGILVMVTDDVISHIKDESSYMITAENKGIVLKPTVRE